MFVAMPTYEAGSVGPDPPRQRGRPRAAAGHRGRAAHRAPDAGRPGGHDLSATCWSWTIELEIAPAHLQRPHQLARAHHARARKAASPPCRTCTRRRFWCPRPRRPSWTPTAASSRQENELSILLGRNPGHDPARRRSLAPAAVRARSARRLPSSLLERRPDIRAAEQQLVAANADIGQAKAAFFPQLTLTGFYGYQTVALVRPVHRRRRRPGSSGRRSRCRCSPAAGCAANLKLAQARFEEALALYQQTVQNAFREVSDSLIAYQRTREFRAQQEERTAGPPRRHRAGQHPLRGRRDQLPRGALQRAGTVHCRAEPRPGPAATNC